MRKTAFVILVLLFSASLNTATAPLARARETSASGTGTFYKYLIIVPDNQSWIDTLQPLIEWKTREGLHYFSDLPEDCLPIKLVNLTEISSAYGSANASSIRHYIRELWRNNSYGIGVSTLQYVLLVGDVKVIPSYLYNVSIQEEDYTYATDQYYADFYDSSLNSINPTVDKTDWEAEVYVGRFPVNNADELANVVNKTVTYEMHSNALQQGPAGWERRMLFLGAVLDNGELEGFFPQEVWKDGAYVAEVVKRSAESWWVGSLGSVSNSTTLHDSNNRTSIWSSGYGNLNNIHNLTATNTINQINTVGYSAVFSVSHGNLQSLQGRWPNIPGYWKSPFIKSSDVSSLNNSCMLPFWFADACNVGSFEADLWLTGQKCLGEELLLADPSTNGGVVSFIGCSNSSWYQYYVSSPQNRPEVLETVSDRLANLTFSQLYHESSPFEYSFAKWGLGRALSEAKRLYNETSWRSDVDEGMHMATCLGFNLLGDPSLQIWSETPQDASTWYNISAPTAVRTGENFTVGVNVTVNPSCGSYPACGPREGAKVSVSQTSNEGTTWSAVRLTDNNGMATVIAPREPGIYNLTVVDHPYLVPYLSQIEVLPSMHDVAVTNIATSQGTIDQGLAVVINATVANFGGYAETFNVTVYANETKIGVQNVTLVSQSATVLTFTWNTTDFPLGVYVVKAEADKVTGETDTANNAFIASYTVSIISEFTQPKALVVLFLSSVTALLATMRKRKAIVPRIRLHNS